MELLLLFYGLKIAISFSKGGVEKKVNVVLATMFTMPYVLLNTFCVWDTGLRVRDLRGKWMLIN